MYRLMVKFGRGWKMGINVYHSIEGAEKRKAKMESVGHKVKIIESEF